VGNVETGGTRRQVFRAVAGTDTEIGALIRRSLTAVGQMAETAVIALTDGCPRLLCGGQPFPPAHGRPIVPVPAKREKC